MSERDEWSDCEACGGSGIAPYGDPGDSCQNCRGLGVSQVAIPAPPRTPQPGEGRHEFSGRDGDDTFCWAHVSTYGTGDCGLPREHSVHHQERRGAKKLFCTKCGYYGPERTHPGCGYAALDLTGEPEVIGPPADAGEERRGVGSFRAELEHLINRHSMENGSNTPDFLLAEFLNDCLRAFDTATRARDTWYGVEPAAAFEKEKG